MLLVYIEDILIISHDTKPIIDSIASQFHHKEDSHCAPNQYLGATIKIYTDDSASECWAMSSDEYVKDAATDVVEDPEKQGLKLKGKDYHPYEAGYCPEMDVMPELSEAGVDRIPVKKSV